MATGGGWGGEASDPVTGPEAFVGYTLVQAGHVLERRFEAALAGAGVTARQFGALAHLAREPGLGLGQLARLVLITPQSMGDLIGGLEKAGYVARDPNPGRGRRIGVRLTEAGERALAAAIPIVVAFEQETTAELTVEEAARLNGLLHRVLAGAAGSA